jgi:hypothetical protein
MTIRLTLAAAAGLATTAFAASPEVGLVVTKHTVRIDSTPVQGNATVLSGHTLELSGGTGELKLRNGTVLIAANSRVRAYENRAELQAGKIQWGGSHVSATAGPILVQAAKGGQAVVDRRNGMIIVGALRGDVDVKDKSGTVVARLAKGNALAFDEQSGRRTGAVMTNADKSGLGAATGKGGAFAMGVSGKLLLGLGLSAAAASVPAAVTAMRDEPAAISR